VTDTLTVVRFVILKVYELRLDAMRTAHESIICWRDDEGVKCSRVLVASLVGIAAAAVPVLPGGAQTSLQKAIGLQVAIGGQLPAGVTGYAVDVRCKGLVGAPTPADIASARATFGRDGGQAELRFAVGTGSTCWFRLTVLGTGPRQLVAQGVHVGLVSFPVTTPAFVDGVAVDVGTVVETDFLPVEGDVTVRFGTPPPTPTTSTTSTTTTAPAPTTTATSTIAPAVTTPTTPNTAPRPLPVTVPTTRAPRTVLVCRTQRVRNKSGRLVTQRICRREIRR
jgi:hypothetical protein